MTGRATSEPDGGHGGGFSLWRRSEARNDRGAVTAELALGLPLLMGVTVVLCWLLALGIGQVRVQDAARETARAAARGDDAADAVAVGKRVAPSGSSVSLQAGGEHVVATVVAPIPGPDVLVRLPGVRLRAEAVALNEDRQ